MEPPYLSSCSHTIAFAVLHESTLSPSTESRWSFVVIPLLLFATCTLRSSTIEWETRCSCAQTKSLSSQANTHRVQFTFTFRFNVERAQRHHEYRVLLKGEKKFSYSCNHSQRVKLRAERIVVVRPRAPPVCRSRPRELRAIRSKSTCPRSRLNWLIYENVELICGTPNDGTNLMS